MEIQEILNERTGSHGDFVRTAKMSQEMKDLVMNKCPSIAATHRESLEMICVKISRICNGNPNEVDHWRDIAGYAQLVVNVLEDK